MHVRQTPDISGIAAGLDTIEQKLGKYGLTKKEITKARLISEELMTSLIGHADTSAEYMLLSVRKWMGEIVVEISVPGTTYDFSQSMEMGVPLDTDDIGKDAEVTIRNMILKSFASDLKYRNQGGVNSVRLTVVRSNNRQLYYTLGSMLLAIIVGLVFKLFSPESVNQLLSDHLFSPIKTMFMNGLNMVVAPVVFFSIISAVGQFGNLSDMGKIGGKVLGLYLLTTLFATAIGIGIGYLFQLSGDTTMGITALDISSVASQEVHISIKDMLVNIVPSNFTKPFLEANMLQLIFLAVICGIASGMIGSHGKTINDFFSACNELFLKITTLLIKFMPIAVFCSIMSLILTTGMQTLLPVLGICVCFLAGLVLMMSVYCLILLLMAKLNPIPFVKKYSPVMAQVASMASSNASLSLNMSTCEKRLGISPRVYSLSLPLGATMNMDGTCVYLGVFALGLAKLYGIDIMSTSLLPIVASIIILSIGAPGVSGAGLVCLSVLLTQLNVPVEAVGLIMGIDPLLGMLRTMSNCLGDVVVSTIVAKSENLLDMDIYNKEAKKGR